MLDQVFTRINFVITLFCMVNCNQIVKLIYDNANRYTLMQSISDNAIGIQKFVLFG